MKLGIIGMGVVGGNLYQWLKDEGNDVAGYDKNEQAARNTWEELAQSDILFLCLPTPYIKEEGIDLSAMEEVCGKIGEITERKIVVIKSTVPPGTTADFAKKYSQHAWLFSPEFLREVSAYEDTANPDLVVIGNATATEEERDAVAAVLPKKDTHFCSSEEAELIKYGRNVFLATKVVFGNILFEAAQKLGADYEKVREGISHDPRIGESHLFVNHNGGRGAGGTCFPKDLAAFCDEVAKMELEGHKVLDEVQTYNSHLLEQSNKSKGNQYKEKVREEV